MPFQWIFDNAVDIQINKRAVTAQTITRDQTVRASTRGGNIWRFSVTPSPGLRWNDEGVRSKLEELDNYDRFTKGVVSCSGSSLSKYFKAQGGLPNETWTAGVTKGSNIISLSSAPYTVGSYRFRRGDLIQFSNPSLIYKVYTAAYDVSWSDTTMTLNRPVSSATGTYNIVYGVNCQFRLMCTSMPLYKITPLGMIEWSGTFDFMEAP